MGDYQDIQYDVCDGIATITLSRPEQLNAYTPRMGEELLDAFDRTDGCDDVRVVLVTGAGRAFCAGADVSGGGDRFRYPDGVVHEDPGGRLTLRLFASLKPVIAAINGPAAGIGATLPLAADIRLASSSAKFSFGFTRIGIVPEAASAWFLPAVVGIAQALEWTMTGRRFDADEARAGGLVRSIHPPEDLLQAARSLAAEIAENTAPVSVALTRQLMWRMARTDHPMAAHRIDSQAMRARGSSADAREGIAAFLAKRRPAFPDQVSTGLPDFFPWWHDEPFDSAD
jgi:enoyl-CoA hydratase/carnithine racemase